MYGKKSDHSSHSLTNLISNNCSYFNGKSSLFSYDFINKRKENPQKLMFNNMLVKLSGQISTSAYDKRDDLSFPIVHFYFYGW